jgi:hypothetical protein
VLANLAVLVPNAAKDGSQGQLMDMSFDLESHVTLYPEVVAISTPSDPKIHVRHSSVFGKKILNYPTGCDPIRAE